MNTDPRNDESLDDDWLRLIFTCCHPALGPDARIALTLREVCGLTTEQVARMLTVAQSVAQLKDVDEDDATPVG